MSICSRCGVEFSCAMADGGSDQPCWCVALPPLVAVPQAQQVDAGATCWCPACLKDEIARRTVSPV